MDSLERWDAQQIAGGEYRHHPNEVMLKVLCSPNYVRQPVTLSGKVLDVGCFRGNNLVPLHDRGMECHGVEINDSMVASARERAPFADIRIGSNRRLPYEGATFDLLLSINTIHYEPSIYLVKDAIAEFRRVLKPSGRAFVMTHGPSHFIQATAQHLPGNTMEVRLDDHRKGTIQTAFTDQHMLADACSIFPSVETGYSIERYPTKSLHFLWALAGS